ncbi:cobalamin biosynthesis bifunctional protein CbiET, partial [Streptomyces scabiei]|nr:cobalamin biosynthesis bifunctional protein CbiET [Streptomyces scabiei]
MTPARPGPPHAVTVVGLGADGWQGLPDSSRAALREAEVLIGGPRQLDLLPPECAGTRITWPSPLRPA